MRLKPIHLLLHRRDFILEFTDVFVDFGGGGFEQFLGGGERDGVEGVADFVAVGIWVREVRDVEGGRGWMGRGGGQQ